MLRRVFALARLCSPSVVFLDELQAIVGNGGHGRSGGNTKQLLTQLLLELDGLASSANEGSVCVLGATNMPSALDAALLMPGRFDTIIEVGLPNTSERVCPVKFAALCCCVGESQLSAVENEQKSHRTQHTHHFTCVFSTAFACSQLTILCHPSITPCPAVSVRRIFFGSGARKRCKSARGLSARLLGWSRSWHNLHQDCPGLTWRSCAVVRCKLQ